MTAFPIALPDSDPVLASRLHARIDRFWPPALAAFRQLYAGRDDLARWEERLARRLLDAALSRPAELQALDHVREETPDWFQSPDMVGYCTYIDRFAGTIQGVRGKLDALQHLGVRYFHPLPLLRPRDGDSDGGFAVADFREVDPKLGSIDDLRELAADLRARGISLCLDIVCNHTADSHEWAVKARTGDPAFRDFYHVVATPAEVAALEAHLGQVFPQTAPGNFTFVPEMGGHVWTTFYPFQWDLNYANPAVFIEMLDVLFYLANQGAEVFRLDSAPFLWKQPGTDCRGLPQTHLVVRTWRALLSIAAPAVALKAEAIVGLSEVLPFLGDAAQPECHLAYNNTAMTALWAALATGDTGPVARCLHDALARPAGAGWLTYVRCHDDIIWGALKGVIPDRTLAWISDFYAGVVPGSFADGRAFQGEPGAVRSTNGMAASLAGVRDGAADNQAALDRLHLLYGVTFALDGIPTLYMGDERALTNDPDYASEPDHDDGRWLHRPRMDWTRDGGPTLAALTRFADLRRGRTCLHARNPARPLEVDLSGLLAFDRTDGRERLVCLGNFTGGVMRADLSAVLGPGAWTDLLEDGVIDPTGVTVRPWGLRWLYQR